MPHYTVDMLFAMPDGFSLADSFDDLEGLDRVMIALDALCNGPAIHSDSLKREFRLFMELEAPTPRSAKRLACKINALILQLVLPQYSFKRISKPRAREFVPVS